MNAASDIRFVEVDGRRLAYRRVGGGAPLVLVHGAVCDSRVWRIQLDSFADEFDVVAWDAPGCGQSDDPPKDFSMSDYASALAGLLAALDISRPHLLGHSFGSCVVLDLVRQQPALARSLTLVGGYAGWKGSLPAEDVARRLQFALDAAASPEPFDLSTMPGLISEMIEPALVDELIEISRDVRPGPTATMARALADADLRGSLGDIAVPTLVLGGSADARSTPEVAAALHAAIPGSTLKILPGLGHECFHEDPGTVAAEMRLFLNGVEGL